MHLEETHIQICIGLDIEIVFFEEMLPMDIFHLNILRIHIMVEFIEILLILQKLLYRKR